MSIPQEISKFDVLARLQGLGLSKRVPKGRVLISEGDPVDGFYWVEEGLIRIFQMSLDGKEFEIARFGANQWVAPALALSTEKFPHFVMALESSKLLFFPRQSALERIAHDPVLSMHFLKLLAERCRSLHKRLHTLQLQTLRDRLEQYLVQECSHDGKCSMRLGIPKKELAQVLGTTPETLSRTLRQMEAEGRIAMKGRDIRVLQCGRKC